MQMFDATGAVLLNVLRTAAFGAAAGLTLDIVNGWKSALRPKKAALFAADLAWCVSAAVCFFMLLLAFADGSLRLLWFIGAACGGYAYSALLGRTVRRVFAALFRLLARAAGRVRAGVLRPIAAASKKTAVFFSKPLIFLLRCIKITLYGLKSGKVKRRIAGRKRRWLRERKRQKAKGRC